LNNCSTEFFPLYNDKLTNNKFVLVLWFTVKNLEIGSRLSLYSPIPKFGRPHFSLALSNEIATKNNSRKIIFFQEKKRKKIPGKMKNAGKWLE
jgi:hypothetical protein